MSSEEDRATAIVNVYREFCEVWTCGFCTTVCETVHPILSDRCLSCPVLPVLSVCLSVTLVYCDPTVGRFKMKLGTEVALGPGHIVLQRNSAPQKKDYSPQFSAHVCCGQTARWIKMPVGTKVGLDPGDIVLDGDTASPPPERGTAAPCFRPMSIVA